ncbi:MAG: HD domain-containing protein [Lachnospiraceae bacterium]|nr:HD domain-containing protein [Lachnospiraceae bacterium]
MEKEPFQNYIKRMTDIRILSSPVMKDADGADSYSRRLKENFQRIGHLARENREMLDKVIFPLTDSKDLLTEEEIVLIREFNDSLVNYMAVENLDSAIMSLLSDRLMQDAERKQDEDYLIQELHEQVVVCHTFMYMTSRIATNQEICGKFRTRGLDAAGRLMEYLDHEKFAQLSEESKDHVLMVTRFSATLHGSAGGTSVEQAHQWVLALERAMAVYEDPFYRKDYPDYDWDYYLFRTLEYYSAIMDYMYRVRPEPDDLKKIVAAVERQEALYAEDEKKYSEYSSYPMVLVSYYQAKYLSGSLSLEEYRRKLLGLYAGRDRSAYDFDNLFVNLRCPVDTILSMDPSGMTEREKTMLGQFYHDACAYVFRMPNSGTLSELLELYTPLLLYFVEVPGKITFEEMGLRSLAAFHPPTYVHSRMVAYLSRCIVSHLLEEEPSLFVGMPDCEDVESVKVHRDEILSFTFHAALCHDFGKLPMIDTIFIYGRRLLDFEFENIKQHPDLGAHLLGRNESTKRYLDVARGHHRWYDNSRGYPETFDTARSSVKTIIDIVACADCLDAATDTIGRSYNQGKTLEDFQKELAEGSGTRYAPYLYPLFQRPEVQEDLQYFLTEGRQNNYKNTYLLLLDVQEMAES